MSKKREKERLRQIIKEMEETEKFLQNQGEVCLKEWRRNGKQETKHTGMMFLRRARMAHEALQNAKRLLEE